MTGERPSDTIARRDGGSLLGELGERRADEDAKSLIGCPDRRAAVAFESHALIMPRLLPAPPA